MSIAPALLAMSLAFHPYSAPSGAFRVAEPAAGAEAQPGWEDVEADSSTDEPPAPELTPETTPPEPTPKPAATPPGKPNYNKGTGLVIGASVTGGLAWGIAFTRMAFVKQCQDKLEEAETIETGASAGITCVFRAGAANALLLVLQVPLNWATWGLATGAGIVRGRHDGVEHAWARKEARKTGAFIGAGAALLGVGVIGRVTAAAFTSAPYKKLGEGDVDGFTTGLRLRYFGIQLSSATIAAGAGLLAYGLAYKKHHEGESARLQQVRVSPAFSIDRASGSSYSGVALSGRF